MTKITLFFSTQTQTTVKRIVCQSCASSKWKYFFLMRVYVMRGTETEGEKHKTFTFWIPVTFRCTRLSLCYGLLAVGHLKFLNSGRKNIPVEVCDNALNDSNERFDQRMKITRQHFLTVTVPHGRILRKTLRTSVRRWLCHIPIGTNTLIWLVHHHNGTNPVGMFTLAWGLRTVP